MLYVLRYQYYETNEILGIFSTLRKAKVGKGKYLKSLYDFSMDYWCDDRSESICEVKDAKKYLFIEKFEIDNVMVPTNNCSFPMDVGEYIKREV